MRDHTFFLAPSHHFPPFLGLALPIPNISDRAFFFIALSHCFYLSYPFGTLHCFILHLTLSSDVYGYTTVGCNVRHFICLFSSSTPVADVSRETSATPVADVYAGLVECSLNGS